MSGCQEHSKARGQMWVKLKFTSLYEISAKVRFHQGNHGATRGVRESLASLNLNLAHLVSCMYCIVCFVC